MSSKQRHSQTDMRHLRKHVVVSPANLRKVTSPMINLTNHLTWTLICGNLDTKLGQSTVFSLRRARGMPQGNLLIDNLSLPIGSDLTMDLSFLLSLIDTESFNGLVNMTTRQIRQTESMAPRMESRSRRSLLKTWNGSLPSFAANPGISCTNSGQPIQQHHFGYDAYFGQPTLDA